LLLNICAHKRPAAGESGNPPVSLGIYIHVPFCRSKCNYCHFLSIPFDRATADRYCRSVVRETELVSRLADSEEVDSIYFGGGTPSLLRAGQIKKIVRKCKQKFAVTGDCEVSLEANPGTTSSEKASALRKAGVNRISLGAQSFEDRELVSIGRIHNSDLILKSLNQFRSGGFDNLNIDLLLGLPNQTRRSWRHSLQSVARTAVPHISVYMLDLDEPCELSSMVARGKAEIPGDDLISDLYLETIEFLSGLGYIQYEISNFALPGYCCRHNLKYWTREPVYGLGLGSHSFDRRFRYSNFRRLDAYFRSIDGRRLPIGRRNKIASEQALQEALFLGLRLTGGVDWTQLRSTYEGDKLEEYEHSLKELSARGLIVWEGPVARLTAAGMLLSNEIFQLFV
jgi:oxygen-independent coproporphyrinogen-3 oxidase